MISHGLKNRVPTSSFRNNTRSRHVVLPFLLVLVCGACCCQPLLAQENFLVTTNDDILSLYDLATTSLIESTKVTANSFSLVPGPNNRLAFYLSSTGLSVVDLTINRVVKRLKDVSADTGAMTPDGKFLLVADYSRFLDIIDTAQLKVVRRVSLGNTLGQGYPTPGVVVIAKNKAFIVSRNLYQLAVVDLTTYATSSILLPTGSFFTRNAAGATPDGSVLVVAQRQTADNKLHIILINPVTNAIIADNKQSAYPYSYSFAMTPDGMDPSRIFGYVATYVNGTYEVLVVDLRTGSPTYGQVLPATATSVGSGLRPYAMAVNSDGSRLLVSGYSATGQPVWSGRTSISRRTRNRSRSWVTTANGARECTPCCWAGGWKTSNG